MEQMCNKTQYSVNIRIGHVEISVEGYFFQLCSTVY